VRHKGISARLKLFSFSLLTYVPLSIKVSVLEVTNMKNTMIGKRFEHTRWLDPSHGYDKHVPATFQVTRIAQGRVYFRPVYVYVDGETRREELGSGFHTDVATFEAKDVRRWL
jgi:hypothetical protein